MTSPNKAGPGLDLPFVGKRVRVLRQLRGLSPAAFINSITRETGEQLIAASTLRAIEAGKSIPTPGTALVIATALGCTVADLCDLEACDPAVRALLEAYKAGAAA